MAPYFRCLYSILNASKNIVKAPVHSVEKRFLTGANVKCCFIPTTTAKTVTLSGRFHSSESQSTKSEGVTNEETTTDKPSRPLVDVETSKRYLKSDSYSKTYLGSLVWQPYRRNHKGHLPPRKIRRSCYIGGKLATGNPCPICRDQYLVLHPENVDLLKQFVSPYTGKVLPNHVTNLCQIQHKKLLVSIEQAWDSGNLPKAVPFKEYNYEDYYPELRKKKGSES